MRFQLDAQAAATGLPVHKIHLSTPCSNEAYAALMADALAQYAGIQSDGFVFADLTLSMR